MPLQKSCSLDALRANITELVSAGHARDQAVAIAHATLRAACSEEGKPTPSVKDVAGVARGFKRKRGERGDDYLQAALDEAKKRLPHRDFAVIHQTARSRAGGRASARARFTPVEKSLLLGASSLTDAELVDALERSQLLHAADMRRGLDVGGMALADMLWAEKTRRDVVAKDDPGSGDVHVSTALGGQAPRKRKKPALHDETGAGISTMADRSSDPGVMIALRLPPNAAAQLAGLIEGGEPVESLHVTLAYLGRMSEVGPGGLVAASNAIQAVCCNPILKGAISGFGRFTATESSDGKDVVIGIADVPGLTKLRAQLVSNLHCNGVGVSEKHDFTPHVTLAYVEPGAALPAKLSKQRAIDVFFDKVVLSVNDADTAFALGAPDPLEGALQTALAAQAREAGEAAISTAPAEIVAMSDDHVELETADGKTLVAHCNACDLQYDVGDFVEVSATTKGELVVDGPSGSTVAASAGTVEKAMESSHDARRHETPMPFCGPDDAKIVFVSAAPNELEFARAEPLVGLDGVAFGQSYLTPLGVTKAEVAVGFACPALPRVPIDQLALADFEPWREYVTKQLERFPGATVVALGKAAHEALGDRSLLWLPHPMAARVNEARYSEQVDRKIRRVRKALDDGFVFAQDTTHQGSSPDGLPLEILAGRIGETLEAAGPGRAVARVAKAAGEKQIVYGVVLDPYTIDTQGEWVPPAVIESTAHNFLEKSRVIGREHKKPASATLVESWIEEYPSQADYDAAMAGLPHRAYERKYGSDTVRSGMWIAGVRLGDTEWAAYKRGEITGFSVGGFSFKTQVSTDAMPKVEFVAPRSK